MGPSPGVVALLAAASGSPPANFDLNGSWRNSVHRTAASPASVTNAVAPTAILNVLFRISPLRGEIEFPRGRNRSEGILFLGKLRYADARSAVKRKPVNSITLVN